MIPTLLLFLLCLSLLVSVFCRATKRVEDKANKETFGDHTP